MCTIDALHTQQVLKYFVFTSYERKVCEYRMSFKDDTAFCSKYVDVIFSNEFR